MVNDSNSTNSEILKHSRLSSYQLELCKALYRYGCLGKSAGAKILGISEEAYRCRIRRLKTRGLVVSKELLEGVMYSSLTEKGAKSIGVRSFRNNGPLSVLSRFAISEACSQKNFELLTHEEFLSVLIELEKHLGANLAYPGLPRTRWRIDGDKLSYFHVDLSLNHESSQSLLSKLAKRAKKLAAKSKAWEKVVLSHLTFTVVTPWIREQEIKVAAQANGFRIPVHTIQLPILSLLLPEPTGVT